jgi:3-oxoacyl-[acyl-carrier-protein] synthase II
LREADLRPEDIAHVNAHATSTPAGDIAEAASLRRALGDAVDAIAVSATKASTGHLLGAAGALESLFSVLALHERVAPPTINLNDLDPAVDLDVVCETPRPLGEGDLVVLNNSFGFGGHNVALLFSTID